MSDFVAAFAAVGPSMQRGFQVQVEKMNWSDVGGLKEVKKVISNFIFISIMTHQWLRD